MPARRVNHLHSYEWFDEYNIDDKRVYEVVTSELAVDRHGHTANFLFLDGHVESIPTDQIGEWCRKPFNFARVQT